MSLEECLPLCETVLLSNLFKTDGDLQHFVVSEVISLG